MDILEKIELVVEEKKEVPKEPYDLGELTKWFKERLSLFKQVKREGEAYMLDFTTGFKYVNGKTLKRLIVDVSKYKGIGKAVLIFDMKDDEKWKLK